MITYRGLSQLRIVEKRCERFKQHKHAYATLNSRKVRYPVISKVTSEKEGLRVEFNSEQSAQYFPFLWLRDNAESDFDNPTCQRQVDTAAIPIDIAPNAFNFDDPEVLSVTWPDGTSTSYTSKYLSLLHGGHSQANGAIETRHWKASNLQIPSIQHEELSTKNGLRKWLKILHSNGFAILENTPTSLKDTRKTLDKIGVFQNSCFGDFWDVKQSSDPNMEHADTAYSNGYLDPHTDGCYLETPPGVQAFHVIEQSNDGGENMLVDGFQICDALRVKEPKMFEFMTQPNFEFFYKDKETSYKSRQPLIKLDPTTRHIYQFRFNNYDRSPPSPGLADLKLYYATIQAILDLIRDPEYAYQIKLKPGELLLTNNWRVMHGRTEFIGNRRMLGCYISMDDFTSKMRVLNGDAK